MRLRWSDISNSEDKYPLALIRNVQVSKSSSLKWKFAFLLVNTVLLKSAFMMLTSALKICFPSSPKTVPFKDVEALLRL